MLGRSLSRQGLLCLTESAQRKIQMSSMKRRAREKGSGKFAVEVPPDCSRPLRNKTQKQDADVPKCPVGRPKSSKAKTAAPMQTFEVSITISVGGADIDRGLLLKVHTFLVEKTSSGKCSLERGGTAFHLHLQMVARLQEKSMVAISWLVKSYLGWDKSQAIGGMVMCRKLANKGLHTFYGMVGYCMKDSCKDHFETIDHNVSVEDINLGMEQYALYGQEENKNRVVLTTNNLVERVFMWRKFNCKHPLIVDFSRDLYEMLKSGKYYPAASWVVGGYGKGYEPYRMQSLYQIMVNPLDISRQDVSNVFEAHDAFQSGVPRKTWFNDRWQGQEFQHVETKRTHCKSLFSDLEEIKETANKNTPGTMVQETTEVQPRKIGSKLDVLCEAALETPDGKERARIKKGKRKASPTRHLWPEEWNMDQLSNSSSSYSASEQMNTMPNFIPLYTQTDPLLIVV